MPARSVWILVGLALVLCGGDGTSLANPTLEDGRLRVGVTRVARRPVLEDFLDMKVPADLAGTMTLVDGFVQRTPVDGAPSSQLTHAYMGYDDEHFFVAFVAFDDEPDKIRARLGRRENLFGDEIVEIQLDTFNDEIRAFSFISNPLGIQFDAIWTEGQRNNFDQAWDTVWHSEGQLTDRGYVVLMTIPFKSLRFDQDADQVWGLVLARDIPRNNENSFWPPISNRVEGRLNQSAKISGLRDVSPGRNMWLIPYGSARNFRTTDDETGDVTRDSFDGDIGLDGKIVIKDSMTLDLTANPDFSQVESDQPQVTVNQRFEVRFPEKRPFFLENSELFNTQFNLLFTRRIQDPRAGARLSGKLGGWSLGAMVIDDEAPGKIVEPGERGFGDSALFGVLRVKRDVGSQSQIGLMYTRRDFDDESNQIFGFDGRIKLNDHWDTQFQAVTSDSETRDGDEELLDPIDLDDESYSLAFNRTGRSFGAHIHYTEVGPDFRAATGFIPRTDTRNGHSQFTYTFWPEGERLINWGGRIFVERILDHQDRRQDKAISPSMFWEFAGQTRVELGWSDRSEALRVQDFEALGENTDFETDGYRFNFNTQFIKTLSVNAGFSAGDAINFVPTDGDPPVAAERLNGNLGLTLRLGRRTRIDGTYLLSQLDDAATGERVFDNQIARARLNWQFDPRFSVRLILQYEETETNPFRTSLEDDERVNGDVLLTYLVNPWTAIYLGYNSNYRNIDVIENELGETEVIRTRNDLHNDSNQLFFKVNYLFQF